MGRTKNYFGNKAGIRKLNNIINMRNLKITLEELKFDKKNRYVDGCFTLSNNQTVKFEATPEYCRQWGASKEECGFTIDRLSEIKDFYFGISE